MSSCIGGLFRKHLQGFDGSENAPRRTSLPHQNLGAFSFIPDRSRLFPAFNLQGIQTKAQTVTAPEHLLVHLFRPVPSSPHRQHNRTHTAQRRTASASAQHYLRQTAHSTVPPRTAQTQSTANAEPMVQNGGSQIQGPHTQSTAMENRNGWKPH